MIRAGNLIPQIAELENLQLAFWKAAIGKRDKKNVRQYQDKLQTNLLDLQSQLIEAKVNVGNYHYFTIKDPKERVICAADFSQRILHHAIMNICVPFFERRQIVHSYACRVKKGTYAALNTAKEYCKQYAWYLKLDFRKYFNSIDHNKLFWTLQKTFKDSRLLQIFKQIIESYDAGANRGIPIGNLSSQYFANHFLSFADHYALEQLRVPAYLRYMDDVFMWSNEKSHLLEIEKSYRIYTENELKLDLKPLIVNKVKYGLHILGYKLYKDEVKLTKRSKKRFVQKLNLYENCLLSDEWSQEQFQQHATPLFAFVNYAETAALRKKALSLYGQ